MEAAQWAGFLLYPALSMLQGRRAAASMGLHLCVTPFAIWEPPPGCGGFACCSLLREAL